MASKPKPNVIQFPHVPLFDNEEEAPVTAPPSQTFQATTPPPAVLDLSGKPKVWFVGGPGRSGKSTLLRYVAEISVLQGGTPIIAAADPQNRSLKNYLENVAEPPTNDALETSRWLERLLRYCMDDKSRSSALIDLGGGDTSLDKLLTAVPGLTQAMDDAGVTPVAIYMIGPRVDDMSMLTTLSAAGFNPAATALVRNEGLGELLTHRDAAFARVTRHSVYRAAVDRGATEVWMPRLEASVAQEIESKRISFIQARDAISPEGRRVAPLGPFDRARVRRWLDAMAVEMSPIASWMP